MRLCIGAEMLKLSRQRGALLWGFLLVPCFTILVGCLLGGGLAPPVAGVAPNAIQPLHSAARALNIGGNPIAQLFYAIGAAAVFAVEYRYSGWRHIVPRASRLSLLVSKLLTFVLFAALSLALVAIGDALVTLIMPVVRGVRPVVTDATLASVALLFLCFLVSLAELTVLASLVALVAVSFRSAMGAIVAPFLLSLAAAMAQGWLGSGTTVPLPTFAGDALRAWLAGAARTAALDRSALIGLATLIAWAGASFGATVAIFARQDLVSE
jgi:hypothetical protein